MLLVHVHVFGVIFIILIEQLPVDADVLMAAISMTFLLRI